MKFRFFGPTLKYQDNILIIILDKKLVTEKLINILS